jgi:hypothetical protein
VGRSGRVAAGVVAAGVPLLALASPAAAATASDMATASVSFTPTAGGTVVCPLVSQHDVDTASGQLAVGFSVGGAAQCQGTLWITVHYVDTDGHAQRVGTKAGRSARQELFINDAGSTAVTADFAVTFDNCQSGCDHELQTKTK